MSVEIAEKAVPEILILLASYNGRTWLAEQIDSILQQESVTVRIHISDDASNDGTEDFIRDRYGLDLRVVYERRATPSGSAGANFRTLYRTARLEGADFIALADQDDIWDKQKMISAVRAMSQSGAAGYSCSVLSFWADGRKRVLRQASDQRATDFLFEGAGQGCTFVIRKDVFQEVQKFCLAREEAVSSLHYHDWLIYLLARAWGKQWYFDPVPHMQYRQHDGNEIGARGSIAAVTKRLQLISNGWYRKQVAAAITVFKLANGISPDVDYLEKQMADRDSVGRRVRIAYFAMRSGRRKASERVLMAASALAGYI